MKKTFIQELMSDHEGRRLYFREDLIFEVTEVICKTMQEKGISTKEEYCERVKLIHWQFQQRQGK